jgi:type I restriction enzyme S subunit
MKFSSSSNRPSTWKEFKLEEVCKTFTSGGTPSRKKPEYFENGIIPWVRTKELNDGVITEVEEFITSEALKNSSAKMLPKNTVLLAMYGATVGKLGVLGFESSCNQACAAMVPKDGVVDYRFLYYLLLNHRELIISQATGGAQQNLSGELIKGFTFDFPTYKEQQAISEIFWKIDEKIAANNALSKTLEGIAQTIFKSWFIDFDPVKAKMAGEKPAGMDAATAALFPDSMEESDLGLIPKGWENKRVEEILKRITVKGLPKSTVLLNLGRTLVLEQGDTVIAGFIDAAADVEATNELPAFVFGDHTCRMRLSTMPFSIFSNTIVLTSELINTYWAFGATWGLQKFESYRRHWMELAYKVLVVPKAEVANVYGEQVKPLFESIDSLMVQNRVLSALRDFLLPRLISGELQVPEEMLAS